MRIFGLIGWSGSGKTTLMTAVIPELIACGITVSTVKHAHHACAVVMGLRQPGELYDTCVRSLDNSLSGLDQSRLVSTDRRICAKERLKPGTPAFADCVVDAEQAPAGVGR